jgi:pimeloyl-ACP methyl ester carboxylesterase
MLSNDLLKSMQTMQIDLLDPFELIRRIDLPVLFFIGDKENSSIVSKETAQEAARVNKRVQVVHLEGASHDIRRTRFDGYMPALTKFLKEIHSA